MLVAFAQPCSRPSHLSLHGGGTPNGPPRCWASRHLMPDVCFAIWPMVAPVASLMLQFAIFDLVSASESVWYEYDFSATLERSTGSSYPPSRFAGFNAM